MQQVNRDRHKTEIHKIFSVEKRFHECTLLKKNINPHLCHKTVFLNVQARTKP